MIWDFIRDFIVENITGGYTSTGRFFSGCIGMLVNEEDSVLGRTALTGFQISNMYDDGAGAIITPTYISMGDWLATTLTIICMCLIVAFAIWLVIWVFKAVAHAFLLRR